MSPFVLKAFGLLVHVLPFGLLVGWIAWRSRWFPALLLIYLVWYFLGAAVVMARADGFFGMLAVAVLGPLSFPLIVAELLVTYPQVTVVPFVVGAGVASALLFIPILRSELAPAILIWHAVFLFVGNEATDLVIGDIMEERARQIVQGQDYRLRRKSAREMLFSGGRCCHAYLSVGCERRIWSFRRMDFVRETNPRNTNYYRKGCGPEQSRAGQPR